MVTKADPLSLRRALDSARNQRNQIVRGALLPIDTAHVFGACPNCGRLGSSVLGFPDPPYAGQPGQPRFRNAFELTRFLDTLVTQPGPMPAPDDRNQGKQCACGAPVQSREVAGVRYMHAMPGAGAELIAEGVAGGGSLILAPSGRAAEGEKFSWRLFRAPVDGNEHEVDGGLDDGAIEKAFGRPLTLAQTWKKVLDAAKAGTETVHRVEAGYWIWAGPTADKSLDAKVAELVKQNPSSVARGLTELGKDTPLPVGPAWPFWAFEHAKAIESHELRAGVILDMDAIKRSITTQLDRMNVGWREQTTAHGPVITSFVGEATWQIELQIVAFGAAHLGWTLAETVAAAVGESSARLQVLGQFIAAIRKARPEIEFKVDGLKMTPARKDGTHGRPINLAVTPFRFQPGTPEFDREVRFCCDELAKDADATRSCPCGVKAFVAARLFPWQVVEEFRRATEGKSPYIVQSWPEENPKAALLATISCEQHVRVPAADELAAAGLTPETFDKRLATDLSNSIFAVDVSMHEDAKKNRALMVYGPLVASVVMNDHLVSALHDACGRPLRAKQVEAQVCTPNMLVMYEEGFDDDQLDRVLEMGSTADGLPPGADPPFSLTWDVRLDAAPVGRFMNLRPPPPEAGGQGQAGGLPPGPSATPDRLN